MNSDQRLEAAAPEPQCIRRYLGEYSAIRGDTAVASHQRMPGVSELRHIPREPFAYPKLDKQRDNGPPST
jgi:hypothetical protein